MKAIFAAMLLAISMPALAQDADALYREACGPKDAIFAAAHVKKQPPASPDPGKALVYVIQRESGRGMMTRFGVDGSWAGVIKDNSYAPFAIAPGEHHLCAATQNPKHPAPELLHFTAEAGKVYFYLVRGNAADVGNGITMDFTAMDRDEALYLIATDPQSVTKPNP